MENKNSISGKDSHAGAFDAIRLLAAAMVIEGHSFGLLGKEAAEPFFNAVGGRVGVGEAAVFAFFAISGFLVMQSWQRDPNFLRFMMRRTLRIVPALMLVIIASFLVIGPSVTTLSTGEYFSSPRAWSYLAKIFVYPGQYDLPGVFSDNPFPDVVNGSLWTLRLEFTLYLVVAALGWMGVLRWRWPNFFIVTGCLFIVVLLEQTHNNDALPFTHQITTFVANAVPFFVGVCIAQTRLPARIWAVMAIAVISITALCFFVPILNPWFRPSFLVGLPLAVVTVARYGRCDLSRFGDYSYGLYLWGFPVQQCMVHFWPNFTPYGLTVAAGAGAFLMAVISWHLVEKTALRLKPKSVHT